VLRLKQQKSHKLSPPWEGPFIISKALLNGSYYLVDIRELNKRPVRSANEETLIISMMKQIVHGTSHSYVLSTLSTYLGYVIGTSI
jgi:hypothetical protein